MTSTLLGQNIFLTILFSKHPHPIFFPYYDGPSFIPIHNTQIFSCLCSNINMFRKQIARQISWHERQQASPTSICCLFHFDLLLVSFQMLEYFTIFRTFLKYLYVVNLSWSYEYMMIQPVPRDKHSVSVIKTSQLWQNREIIAVCSQIHTKHINTLCGQNVELYIKMQYVPRSKHTPSRLYKPVS